MAKFFVGQRVRLTRPVWPENLGKTGTIWLLYPETWTPVLRSKALFANVCVLWDDGRKGGAKEHGGNGQVTHTDQLDPILPEGQQPVSIEQILTIPGLEDLARVFGREEVR